jgi:hypothetical protein
MSFMKKAADIADRLVIFLCIAVSLLIALPSPVAALVLKLLVPEWLIVALVVVAVVATRKDIWIPQVAPTLSVFSPRPPPIQ